MVDAKIKIIEEKIYEDVQKTAAETELSSSFICLILKNVLSKFQEEAITDLSFRLLSKGNEFYKKEE